MVGIFLYPKSRNANHWLHLHGDELSRAFRAIHEANNRNAPFHPHGLSVFLPPMTEEATFDPSIEATVYLHVSSHEDTAHLDGTWVDLQRALIQVGGSVSDFQVELRRALER